MALRHRKIGNIRSGVLFAVGLIGLAAETYWSLRFHQAPDNMLLVAFMTMLGLPIYWTQDTKPKDPDDIPDDHGSSRKAGSVSGAGGHRDGDDSGSGPE